MVLFWSPNKVQKAYDRLVLDIKKQSEHIEKTTNEKNYKIKINK